MPTVPRVSGFSAAPEAAPAFRQQNPISADVLSIGSRQAEQFGQAMVGAGGAIMAKEKEAFDQANALRVDDALNRATEQAMRLQHDKTDGFTSLKGFDAVNRESGVPLAEEFTQKLDKGISDIASTLGNDRQRQMFQMHANDIRTRFMGQATAYEGAQYRDYNLSTREATVPNAANALILNFSDPKNVEQQVTRIRGAIMGGIDPNTGVFVPGSAQMQGKSAAWAQEKADEAISGAHLGAIQTAMEAGNVNGAMRYRQKYADQLTAADMIKIDGTLQRNYDTMQGARVASEVVQGTASAVNPNDMDRLRTVRDRLESARGDFNPDGSLVLGPVTKSGERAMGGTQVMPSTAKDPGYGIKPADLSGTPQQQAAELRRVGDQKLDVLVKMFDGDAMKALAAYNWGEGNVQKAVKAAQQNAGKGEAVGPTAWMASLPAETRNYVEKAAKMLSDPTASAPTRPTLESLHQQARATLGPNASPYAVKAAVDGVTQQYADQEKAIEQRKNETVSQAMQALTQVGGRFSELPASIRSKLTQLAPDKVDEVMNFGKRVSAGDDTTDPALYLKLTSDPKMLTGMSDAQFYQTKSRLSQSDFEHFANKRADLKAGKGGEKPGDLNDGAISRTLNNRLSNIGIDPTPKDATADAQRVGAIRRFVDSSVVDAQRAAGKKFTDAETQAHIDGLFAKNVQFRTSFLGFSTGTAGQQMLTMKVGDIPSTDADRIKKAFKAQGNDKPSDADLLGAYWAGKTASAQRGAQGSF